MDVNTLIGLGILGVVGYLTRGIFSVREDVRAIKTTLGINGSSQQGLLHEVNKLREAKHDHANALTVLGLEVEALKSKQ